MTAVPDIHEFQSDVSTDSRAVPARAYQIEETYWGYAIHGGRKASTGLVLAQAASWLTGVAFAVIALGMWAIPGDGSTEGLLAFKLGASVPMIGVATLLLWFSGRGRQIDIQIDMNRGEVREVLRNRAGRSTLLGLYGFDSIGGVFMERGSHQNGRTGQARLVLRYRNTAQVLPVAEGPEVMLELLRDRLGRDLMVKRGKAGRIAADVTMGLSKAA